MWHQNSHVSASAHRYLRSAELVGAGHCGIRLRDQSSSHFPRCPWILLLGPLEVRARDGGVQGLGIAGDGAFVCVVSGREPYAVGIQADPWRGLWVLKREALKLRQDAEAG